jgi:hypothetical protein
LGLIDTLNSGFRLAWRNIWLLTLPVLLDLWLWLGPRWSVKPLVEGLITLWPTEALPPDMLSMAASYQQALLDASARFNLWWLLGNDLTWLSVLMPGLTDPARLGQAAVTEVPVLALLLWVPLLLFIGLGLGSLLLTLLAARLARVQQDDASAESTADLPSSAFWARRGLRTWLLVSLYALILLVLLLVVTFLLSLVFTVIFLVAPQLGAGLSVLGLLLVGWGAVWLYLLFYFVVAAVVSDGTGLLEAFWRSVNLVTRNFWSTVGLAVITVLILNGFGLIWQRLATLSPWGALAGILGNAFLLTGLAAARLIFYQDRYALLVDSRVELLNG